MRFARKCAERRWRLAGCHRLRDSARAIALLGLDVMKSDDERVDILAGVVERKGRPHGRLVPEPAQDRLRAMMTGAHCNASAVKSCADSLAAPAIKHEGDYAGFFLCCPDNGQARYAKKLFCCIVKQPMLVSCD